MKEKILCIHHNDSDGRLAGAIVKNKYPKAEMIEVGYNDYKEKLSFILEEDAIPNYEQVYLLDFSLDKESMNTLIDNYNLIWCDHHKSAKEKLETFWHNTNIKGLRSLNRCGAMLINDYFGNESFEELRFVDDYDRWVYKLGKQTHYFAELNKNWSIEDWMVAISRTRTGIMQAYFEKGKMLFELKIDRIDRLIKTGTPVMFKGKKAFLINNTNPFDGALLGNKICESGYDIAVKFGFDKGKIIFGLNSIGDLDVSLIATEYNGGGHKNASGFIIDANKFSNFIEKEFEIVE